MSDDPLAGSAMPFLDDHLEAARAELARAVDRTDAIRDLQEIAAGIQAELRRSPTLRELLTHHPTEKERARVVSLLQRANKGDPQ